MKVKVNRKLTITPQRWTFAYSEHSSALNTLRPQTGQGTSHCLNHLQLIGTSFIISPFSCFCNNIMSSGLKGWYGCMHVYPKTCFTFQRRSTAAAGQKRQLETPRQSMQNVLHPVECLGYPGTGSQACLRGFQIFKCSAWSDLCCYNRKNDDLGVKKKLRCRFHRAERRFEKKKQL